MAIVTRPFAYNLGGPISGTTSFGSTLISGDIEVDYSEDYGGVKWWMGPDEDLGYVIGNSRPGGQPVPSGATGTAQLGFWRSKLKTNESFLDLANYIGSKNGQPPFANTTDAENWLNSQGYYSSFNLPTPTPTPTITNTPTPSQTSIPVTPTNTETPTPTPTPSVTTTTTPTVTQTPTNTPTPSTSPIPVTGYSFNLVELPYNFPTSGNSIMNNAGGISSGSTDPNVLATGSRGFYFNSFDSNGIDRTDYYSGFTGQSVTITLNQTGSTAIYSGDTNSFKQWIQAPTGTGFVFGAGIGVPPVGVPSGNAVLIQSASTPWNFGIPVYVSLVINVPITPTPTLTSTPTPSPNPKFYVYNNSTSRTITSIQGNGPWNLSTGTYPITTSEVAYGGSHPSLTFLGLDQLVIQFGGSGAIDISITKNGSSYSPSSNVSPTNVTASQINYFINNPSDVIQTSDIIVFTIVDTI